MQINRLIIKELTLEIDKPFISILIGPRQVGKTFLMRQLQDACLGRGFVFAKDAEGEVECCNRKVRFMDWQYAEDLEYLRSVE